MPERCPRGPRRLAADAIYPCQQEEGGAEKPEAGGVINNLTWSFMPWAGEAGINPCLFIV